MSKEPSAYTAQAIDYRRDPNGYPLPTPGMPPIPVRRRKPMKQFVKEYIKERRAAVAQDPSLLKRDVKNLQRPFYILAPIMQDYGWEPDGWGDKNDGGKDRRKTVVEYIKDVCDELGIRRADIGIVTDNVGYIYYRGSQYSIGIDELSRLMYMGADVWIVEKQDVALSLSPLTAPYGIALLSTRGFLTENHSDLARLAEEYGANMVIVTDDDIAGYVIAAKVPKVPRIGIDDDTLRELGIFDKKAELEEDYTPNASHFEYVRRNPHLFRDLDMRFLRNKRIHIDRVMEEVGNERFFEWLLKKTEKRFPTRNYNRVIHLPKAYQFTPDETDELHNIVVDEIKGVINPLLEERENQLSEYEGFIDDVDAYEKDIYYECQDAVDVGLGLDAFLEDVKRIVNKWKKGEYSQ